MFDDVILAAVLAYMASEDEEVTSREQINLPVDPPYRGAANLAGITFFEPQTGSGVKKRNSR